MHRQPTSPLDRLRRLAALGLALACAGPALAASPDVVISQVYGGGGNSGSTYQNDFIELHNRGSAPVSLAGWSVQYASATGTSWQVTGLAGVTLQPGQYYLVQEAAGSGGTTSLPAPDTTGAIAMAATAGKVALVTGTTALACGSSCAGNAAVRDYVGYGATANNYEGSGPAPAPSNTASVQRAGNGCSDSDHNGADFATGAPVPRNTAAAVAVCAAPVVDGACGSAHGQTLAVAPTSNLCAAGTASAVTGSGPWNWTCAGSGGGSTASCSASLSVPTGGPFTILHVNDTHARLTPHKWAIPGQGTGEPVFEDVGGAAHVAGKMLALTAANPNALVIDAGDISEGNPIGDFNGSASPLTIGGYTISGCEPMAATSISSNCGMTQFYQLLSQKLAAQRGRGMDAVVVGNHDVRDVAYIRNLENLQAVGVPVLSVNVRDVATHQPHFAPYHIVTVNGTKVGILGYTTSAAEVGATLASTLEVVDCDWTGTAAPCHLADYVNELRAAPNNVDVVVLVAHIGHGALVDQNPAVGPSLLVDDGTAKLPEVVVSGHWHTWTDTAWQPYVLNYKTLFTESSSYFKYIGELTVDGAGRYLGAAQHVLRNADIVPDADAQALVDNLTAQYDAAHAIPAHQVVGYTADHLMLDNDMRWWSPDEYPWSGNNTAGQWITDAMQWKCAQLFAAQGGCDLAIETGGGVRSDIPAGPVTYLQVYETFPWSDDTFVRIEMSGQDIVNFLKEVNLNAGFSRALEVTAVDGVPTEVRYNGAAIDLARIYTVAINNYMYAHPPAGYTWPSHGAPLTDATLMRDGIIEFMQSQHGSPATAYQVGGPRYHFNGEFSGGYRAVVTMMNDGEARPTYGAAFVRLLSAAPDTLLQRGSRQVPADLVKADGSVDQANRLAAQEIYRSYLGFKPGALQPGDIVEFWGKASFYGGNPEFVDQEGIQSDGVEFKIVGHDDSLAKPVFAASIGAFLNERYKNQYVRFLARKTAADTVADQYNQALKVWDQTGYTAVSLPGNVGDTLELSGVLTMENYGYRFRRDRAVASAATLPAAAEVSSRVDPVAAEASAPIALSATAAVSGGGYLLTPSADAQVVSGYPTSNYGSSSNLYVQSSNTGSYRNERAWLKFDLSAIPAGATLTGASLEMWNWKSTGASLPVEVRGGSDDAWTETGINWNNQPAFGSVLATRTLTAGTVNAWYAWDVTAFVQGQLAGDRTASLLVKAASEDAADVPAPSYAFDAREYGSNVPQLRVTTQANASSVASVRFHYRYSADNVSWGAWTPVGAADTAAPYGMAFAFPDGVGYYEFYSVATDNLGHAEPTPAYAQAAVHYQAATGAAQTVSFTAPAPMPVGAVVTVTASASSGLPVTLSSLSAGVCTVSGNTVTAVAAGTCSLAAEQAGAVGYWQPASALQSFSVEALAQSIDFAAPADRALGSGPVLLAASASSGLPVQFSSLTPAVCTVSGASVSLLAAGTCSIAADQPGDAAYAPAAQVVRSFAVTQATAGNDGDVPLPAWALALLGAGLLGAMRRRLAAP